MAKSKKQNVSKRAKKKEQPDRVLVVPIMNSPIFPGMIAPIILTEDKFIPELEKEIGRSGYVGLNLVKYKDENLTSSAQTSEEYYDEYDELDDYDEEDPEDLSVEVSMGQNIQTGDIYKVGVLCKIVKKLQLPDGSINLLVQGMKRYRVEEFVKEEPVIVGTYELFDDIVEEDDEELDAYTRSVINQVKKLGEANPYFNEEMKLAMLNSPSTGLLADLVAFSLSLDISEAQDFLETLMVKKRFAKLLVYLKREKDVADIQKKISDEVNDKVNKYQREYFLREQLKVIKAELGIDEDDKSRDINRLKELMKDAGMPEEAKKTAEEELERLELIPDSSPEYNISRSYLTWLIELPWSKSTDDHVDIEASQKILQKDHYGLEKAKERILEFLAVRKLKPQYDGTILCFAGPPGVGKTSLGKSIANSLGRKFYRFSLGGMRDEAEIKGHRRTYIGAMPGRILQAIKRVEVNNPVIMLDEIDKLGQSFQGDPASALLEVLDPEQNNHFIDNYLDVPFDLSKVLFIATANYINDIPAPLLDRMEVIELSGYTVEEKVSIASKWVIPRQLEKHGLNKSDFSLKIPTLKKMIFDYAREPGVRTLDQLVAKLCRRAALEKVSKPRSRKKFDPKPENLESLLGPAHFQSEVAEKTSIPGVVTGLAWTSFGGEILFIETMPLSGKGGFKLTGQLGDVMNESANIAYSYIKKTLQQEIAAKKRKASEEIPEDYLSCHEVHLHLPAGATPKDGPSAGITMALALYSLATNQKVRATLAMTGELSLTGKVLPVGGIKEKVLAAKRAGIKEIIIPKQCENDLKEVPELHRKGVKFYPVAHFDEVKKIAFKKKK